MYIIARIAKTLDERRREEIEAAIALDEDELKELSKVKSIPFNWIRAFS